MLLSIVSNAAAAKRPFVSVLGAEVYPCGLTWCVCFVNVPFLSCMCVCVHEFIVLK